MTRRSTANSEIVTASSVEVVPVSAPKFDPFGFEAAKHGAIVYAGSPLSVRFNCQSGQLAKSEQDFYGSKMSIIVLKISKWIGSLGKSVNKEWIQLFYVPVAGCVPAGLVCVSYIKTRSISNLHTSVLELIGKGINPAGGVFDVSFTAHPFAKDGETGIYHSVKFDWREIAESEKPMQQAVIEFMGMTPELFDTQGTRGMVCVDSVSSLAAHQALLALQDDPDLTLSQALALGLGEAF